MITVPVSDTAANRVFPAKSGAETHPFIGIAWIAGVIRHDGTWDAFDAFHVVSH